MSDLADLQHDEQVLRSTVEDLQVANDRADLDLNRCSPETLLQILDAMRVYCMQERKLTAFTEEYSDVMGSIARKVNRRVWP